MEVRQQRFVGVGQPGGARLEREALSCLFPAFAYRIISYAPGDMLMRAAVDKRTEGHLHAEHPLGRHRFEIMSARHKAPYEASCLSAVSSGRLHRGRTSRGVSLDKKRESDQRAVGPAD